MTAEKQPPQKMNWVWLIFLVFGTGIIGLGYVFHRNFEKQYRVEAKQHIDAIAKLKVDELSRWRRERMADGRVLFENPIFSDLARRVFAQPADNEAQRQIRDWLGSILAYDDYDQIRLMDTQGVTRLSLPDALPPASSSALRLAAEVVQTGRLDFDSFYRNERDGRVYLYMVVPILDELDTRQPVGVVELRIDPEIYLYPLIQRWPVLSGTGETLLVEREGNDVVFLNELRFRKNTALNLRLPLNDDAGLPATMAVLGHKGVVEGVDYRGVPVTAAVYPVPDSASWLLVVKEDSAELYGLVRHRLSNTVVLVAALLFTAWASLWLIWRRQLVQVYLDRAEAAETLRESNNRYRALFEDSPDGIVILDPETARFIEFNNKACHQLGYSREEFGRLCVADIEALESAEETRCRIQEIQRAGRGDFETRQRTKQGEIKDVYVSAQVIKSEGRDMYHCIWRDVTDGKRAEEALRKAQARAKTIIEMVRDPIFVKDNDHRILHANRAFCDLFGLDEDAVIGKTLAENVPADEQEHFFEVDRRVLDTGVPNMCEETLTVNGLTRTIITSKVRVVEDSGEKLLVGSIHDITERKQAEERLRESEYFFKESQRAAFIGSYKADFINDTWESSEVLDHIFGIGPDFVKSNERWLDEIVHPDDREMMSRYIREEVIAQSKPFNKEYRITRKSDGDIRWVNGLGEVHLDSEGHVVSLIGTIQDITERKRAQEERERLMAAIAQAGETIVITDAEGAIQYTNPYFEQVTGYTCEEAIGQNPRMLNSGKHDEAFYKAMWDTLTRGEVWIGQIFNKKKDGTLFTEEATISPVRDASGKTVNYVAVKRDITREIELTAQLRQAQKMEAVGQLAGGIAHDFNNLLQAIFGYGEIALHDVAADSPVHASIEEMMKAGERAKMLVGQLLAFSRRQVLEMKDVNLNDSITELLKMLQRVIGEHITLEVIRCHNLGVVRADSGQIDQILMNLCVNARDAMGESGKITIETENVLIDDKFCEIHNGAKPGRYVLMSVTDTGCGMDQKTLEKVFEPFFTTKDVGKGTGLGLATVYGLVKQHQGYVLVYSEVRQGTTFKIYLPLTERSAAAVVNEIKGPVSDGTETILLAEDNETLLKLTKLFLEHAGYTVLTATDGEEALRVFEEHADEIDVALLDVMMPNLGGMAVYERIRETRPDLPFLFSSGYSMGSIHDNFTLKDGQHLIQKPYRRDDLLRKVREVLNGGNAAPNRNGDLT